MIAQVEVQGLAGDAGLDHAVEVFGMDGQDAIHAGRIDRDPAVGGIDVALERRAGPVGHHRHAMRRAKPDDLDHLVGRLREHHGIGRLGCHGGARVGVLFADAAARGEAVAEAPRQRFHHDPEIGLGRAAGFGEGDTSRVLNEHPRAPVPEAVKIRRHATIAAARHHSGEARDSLAGALGEDRAASRWRKPAAIMVYRAERITVDAAGSVRASGIRLCFVVI